MGLSKTEFFSAQQNDIALFAKAFSHPAMVAILQHLKALKSMGLVQGSIEGNSVCYCIDQKNWIRMKHILSDFLDQNLNPNQCCS